MVSTSSSPIPVFLDSISNLSEKYALTEKSAKFKYLSLSLIAKLKSLQILRYLSANGGSINDLISFSKAWTTTKGRPLSLAEVNEMRTILQSLLPTEEI